MKIITKLKVFMLSLMVVAVLLPTTASGQRNDNLLQLDDNDILFRSGFTPNWVLNNSSFGQGGYNLNNQTFGNDPVPLGGGLLILTAIGAGYAAVRRKR